MSQGSAIPKPIWITCTTYISMDRFSTERHRTAPHVTRAGHVACSRMCRSMCHHCGKTKYVNATFSSDISTRILWQANSSRSWAACYSIWPPMYPRLELKMLSINLLQSTYPAWKGLTSEYNRKFLLCESWKKHVIGMWTLLPVSHGHTPWNKVCDRSLHFAAAS